LEIFIRAHSKVGADEFDKMKRKLKAIAIGMSALLLIYLLSEGPAYSALKHQKMSQKTFSAIYYPVIYIINRSVYIDQAFSWYESIWYKEDSIFDYLDRAGAKKIK
jgi:hypothetical protein